MERQAADAMSGERGNPILRRKASAGRRQHEARAPSAARALRLALARTAETRLRLGLVVGSATEESADQETLPAALDATGLVLLVEGADGRAGAVVLAPTLVAGIVQHQTTGRVTEGPPEARRFTATDAAIVAPLVEGMLDRAAAELSAGPDAGWVEGLRFGARLEGIRALMLALRSPRFRLFRFVVELAGGTRTGDIALALPEPPPVEAAEPAAAPAPDLAAAAERAPVDLDAVLHRLRLPLAEVSGFAPGTVLALPADVLSRVTLTTCGGQSIAQARLGRVDGMRAVCLPGSAADAEPPTARLEEQASPPAVAEPGGADPVATPAAPPAPATAQTGSPNPRGHDGAAPYTAADG